MSNLIKFKRGTSGPTLADGEPGFDTTTKTLYIGEGGTNYVIGGGGGTGTVTSVDATTDTDFITIGGVPITTSGVITIDKTTGLTANEVVATPDGSSGSVSVRALVANDIPSLAASKITSGQLVVARGGTGVDSSSASNGQLLIGNGSGLALHTITAGSNVTVTNGAGTITIAAASSGGTVSSVGLSTDASYLTVGSSPVSTTGTITLNKTTGLAANKVVATPNGTTGVADLRALVAADLPAMSGSTTTTLTGILEGNGSTVGTVTVDSSLSYSGTTLSLPATITAGSAGSASSVPAITYDAKGRLTAVTPTTITPAAIGAPSGSGTCSGTNTGDQTITLTGNVTGSGTGSFATAIANGVVTEAMLNLANNTTANVSTSKHGFAPILPNQSASFLDGTGIWSVPAGSTVTSGVPASPVPGQFVLSSGTGRNWLIQWDSVASVWRQLYSYGNSTLYVDGTLGTDDPNKGTGTGLNAYLTIQYAINAVPAMNFGTVTINIASGTYAENIVIAGKTFVGNGTGLILSGTMSNLDTALTHFGSTQGNFALTASSVTRGAGTWGTSRANKIMAFTSGTCNGTYALIDTTSGATATMTNNGLAAAPANGDTFDVRDWGTIIAPSSGIAITTGSGQSVTLQFLKISGAASTYTIQAGGLQVLNVNYCWLTTQLIAILATQSSTSLSLTSTVITPVGNNCFGMLAEFSSFINVVSCKIDGLSTTGMTGLEVIYSAVLAMSNLSVFSANTGTPTGTAIKMIAANGNAGYCKIRGWTTGIALTLNSMMETSSGSFVTYTSNTSNTSNDASSTLH